MMYASLAAMPFTYKYGQARHQLANNHSLFSSCVLHSCIDKTVRLALSHCQSTLAVDARLFSSVDITEHDRSTVI